ncbi:MAG: pyrroline-5-carboxylate reductase [Gammaproteobacteria bacterium]|nr:pyrroline-5-carboxylate reductase [Gammaproteobacteria bacterium]
MAASLVGGIVSTGYPAQRLRIGEPVAKRRAVLRDRFGVTVSDDNNALLDGADVAVLAVKPQVMRSAVQSLAPAAQTSRPLVISIAAGITEPQIRAWLGFDAAIVRTMPNTPALLQSGITGMYANAFVSSEGRAAANRIMQAVGQTVWLEDEALLDAVTAISGSGPAYFFLLIELLAASGEELGLTAPIALKLALHTALGAARMAMESDDAPHVLREKVTSPGGTTAAALQAFNEGGLAALVQAAATAARDRGRELAAQMDDSQ